MQVATPTLTVTKRAVPETHMRDPPCLDAGSDVMGDLHRLLIVTSGQHAGEFFSAIANSELRRACTTLSRAATTWTMHCPQTFRIDH